MIALLAVFILGPLFHLAAVLLDIAITLMERDYD